MSDLILISHYKDNDKLRQSFNCLAQVTFGIEFEQWYQHGFWDNKYICYSYISEGRVVANASISKMEVLLNGQRLKALQLGTVMTHPDYRNRGLSTRLIYNILDSYQMDYDLLYLFANQKVQQFYRQFGFSAVEESIFTLNTGNCKSEKTYLRKLDISDEQDFTMIRRFLANRAPVSTVLSVGGAVGCTAWYCLTVFPQHVYYIEDLQVIAICKLADGILHLFDCIATKSVELESVLERIVSHQVKQVVFYFTPDLRDATASTPDARQDRLFVRPAIDLPKYFRYPLTAKA